MPETPKYEDQAESDRRRDELARRVLKMPPKPHVKPKGKAESKPNKEKPAE
ncbi:hypothetical protein [Mesorhizobium sp. CN2-181]|uniref:hypothetical protein n=1 Tax=Mesorhizobium yinganensis TaxID=3157707 RepID=UPI0032B824E3